MSNHTAAKTPKVVADGPELYHGDTEAKPRPDPRASNISATAAVANAPAMIAGHDTAEIALSTIFFRPATTDSLKVCIIGSTDSLKVCIIGSTDSVNATAKS